MVVYDSNKARIGVKLWQNAFQTICNFSIFGAETNFWKKFCQKFPGSSFFSKKMRFWRSYDFLIRVGRCVVKSYYPNCPYFWGDFLGEGIKDSICVFDLDLGPKMTSTIWCCDAMIIWYNRTMTVCYRDSMILRIISELHKNCRVFKK